VAKFPKRDDEWPVMRWEAVLLSLAAAAHIAAPAWRLETVARRPVLLLDRFDRNDGVRIPFLSGMAAVDAADHGDQRSYLELADFLRQNGSAPDRDLKELWRRIVFNVLVSNTDDHLRNHAFLRQDGGWRLSPAFDMNPCPVDVKPRIHALAIDERDGTGSLDLVFSVAGRFGLARQDAGAVAAEVGAAVADWRIVAKALKLKPAHIDRMASAFEHADLRKAMGRTLAPAKRTAASGERKSKNKRHRRTA